jgi:hypothetical protein
MSATWDARDALLLAFAELEAYGVLTVARATGDAAQVRFGLADALRVAAPHGMGSYAFWLADDEHLFDAGGSPPIFTSGPEVDLALAAALAHQGYPRDDAHDDAA